MRHTMFLHIGIQIKSGVIVWYWSMLWLVITRSFGRIYYGGGQELFDELMGSLGPNVVSFFNSAMPAQPMGWFKRDDLSQMKV